MRKETWDIDLMKFIKSRKDVPFQWGVHDCTLFVADCIQAMTGNDLSSKYRGYTTEKEAYRIIQDAGGLRQLIGSELGHEISPQMARRGDIVLMRQDDLELLGVCIGNVAIFAAKQGLITKPLSDAITAWRVD